MPEVDQRKIGQILINRGLISVAQLEEALNEQGLTGRFLGEIIVGRGVLTEEQVAKALSEQLGFGFVDLKEMEVESKAVDMIPREMCEKNLMIPIFVSQNTLTVAMANALDVGAVDKMQSMSGMRIRPVFACASDIRRVLEKQSMSKIKSEKSVSTPPSSKLMNADVALGRQAPAFVEASSGVKRAQQEANLKPVIELVNQLVERAVEMGASDIHLEPEKARFNCRYRVDGILHTMSPIPLEEQAAIISRIKIMADMDIAEKRLPQDGRIRMHIMGRDIDLRVSTFPAIYGENMVVRILDRSGGLLKLEQLGFSKQNLEIYRKLIHKPYGMILVTGPTGSGKTTALYAALSEVDSAEKNVITLEDPVEYEIPSIRQSQINVKAGLTFAAGLRSVVRQDPDIIMIGEIRDKETADIAIHAALTGHLVLSTLHTNDAPSAAARLIDMGVEPFLVASSVIGILAQRLIRTLCPKCKKPYPPSKALLEQLQMGEDMVNRKDLTFYLEKGCAQCKNLGYSGRTGIYELMVPNEFIRELITKKSSATKIRDEAMRLGMDSLRSAGIEKVLNGVTSVSEILRVTEEL
jgi:type IV pilus assembly protein PilB